MAPIGTIQRVGSTNSTIQEVELNTLAARYVVRPQDFELMGAYIYTFSTSPTAGQGLLSAQLSPGNVIAVVRRIIVSSANESSAGVITVQIHRILQTDPGALTDLPGNGVPLRSSMPQSRLLVSTATPSNVGTDQLGSFTGSSTGTIKQNMLLALYDSDQGDQPIIISAAGEGINLGLPTSPAATSTTVALYWEELELKTYGK